MPKRAILILVAIVACVVAGFVWLWPAHPPAPALPKGEQTLTGQLNRAPLSLTRRGTHVLSQSGERVCMVESTTVTLDRYEGQNVTLHGVFELNSDPSALPVLVVDQIETDVTTDREERLPSVGVTFAVPDSWQRSGQEPQLQFHIKDATTPILTIGVVPGTVSPAASNLFVSGRLALRVVDAKTGSGTVTVQLDTSRVLTLQFAPVGSDPVAALDQIARITRSLQIASAGNPAGTTGTGASLPCGGTAGILCPKGSYCRITDPANAVGTCAPLSPAS